MIKHKFSLTVLINRINFIFAEDQPMNYNASMKHYITDDIAGKTSNLNPHKIIEEVLKDLKKNMETLAYSLDNEPVI